MTRFRNNLSPNWQLLFCLYSGFVLILLSNTASAWQINSSQKVAPLAEPKLQQINKKDSTAASRKLPDARVAELLGFAKQHHPEILPLLDFLKTKRPKKFDKIINKFDRDVSRLEKAKRKSPEAYQAGLAAWVNQSHIQLYVAQFKVAADEETAAKLREKIEILVAEKVDAKIKSLERERTTAQAKADRLNKAIKHQKATREATIRKRINNVTKKAPKRNKENKESKGKNKPVEKTP